MEVVLFSPFSLQSVGAMGILNLSMEGDAMIIIESRKEMLEENQREIRICMDDCKVTF